jgi:hypothetical protein
MKTKTWATLVKDWTYTDFTGKKVTWAKGRRFLLGRAVYFDNDRNLVLAHWYCYNAGEIIPAEFFAK